MSKLPPTWIMTSLGLICGNGQYGWTTKATNQGTIRFLRTTDITKGKIDWLLVPYCQDNPLEFEKYEIQKNDILISRSGSVGFSILIQSVPFPTVFASYLIRYSPYNNIEGRYVAYFLKSSEYWQQISRVSTGNAISNVNAKKLAEIHIPLAPLGEQKRIADKLDKLFARTDACCDRLARIPQILEKFRQNVLADAMSGYLTEDWRSSQELPNEWKSSILSELCLSITDGDHQAPPQVENGIPFITISAINDKQLNLNKATRFVPHSYFNALNDIRKAQFGDILFSVTGSIGIPAIVNTSEPFVFQRHIAILKPDSSQILNEFLFYYLCTDDIKEQAINSSTGTAQKTIPLSKLKSFVISLPSKDEQQEIVCRIKRLFSYMNCVERHYQTTLEKIEELKSLILEEAFRGELVSPDPNDEPASVLLERIYLTRKTAEVTSAQARQRKSKSDMLTKSKIVMLTRNNIQSSHLSDILKANGSMTAKNLWDISQLLIDDFYDQLKDEEASGLLKEKKEESADILRLLEAV